VTVAKWLALVRLLLGEIPEHGELTAVGMKEALRPYFELTQAVRVGDLTAFRHVLLLMFSCVGKLLSTVQIMGQLACHHAAKAHMC
jgi:hypothetical protein